MQHLCGWRPDPAASERVFAGLEKRRLYDAAPHLAGAWDGKSNVCLWQAEIKVLGHVLPAQLQKKGTCTSRGTTGAANRRQLIQIAAGLNQVYTPTSHAWIYGVGRKIGGMLGREDGGVGAYMYQGMSQVGMIPNATAGDSEVDDALAYQWGLNGPPETQYADLAGRHKCEMAQVDDVQMAADALAGGNLVPVCSDQGFSMARDSDGFCRAQGTWNHCMHFIGVFYTSRGRKGLVCAQSWGEGTPSGPQILDQPSYSFGVDWDVADRMLKQKDSAAIASISGWANPNVPWIFA